MKLRKLLLILLSLVPPACGVKAPPLPPEVPMTSDGRASPFASPSPSSPDSRKQ